MIQHTYLSVVSSESDRITRFLFRSLLLLREVNSNPRKVLHFRREILSVYENCRDNKTFFVKESVLSYFLNIIYFHFLIESPIEHAANTVILYRVSCTNCNNQTRWKHRDGRVSAARDKRASRLLETRKVSPCYLSNYDGSDSLA